MDNITHEVRIANWKEIITKCNDRAEGMTAAQWLEENDIPRDSYYYWLRRVRKESITQTDQNALTKAKQNCPTVTFAEVPAAEPRTSYDTCGFIPDAVIKTDNTTIALSNNASETLITRIMEAVNAS